MAAGRNDKNALWIRGDKLFERRLSIIEELEAAVEAYHQTQKKGVPAFEAQSYAFNALGRQLLRENKLKSAIEVFKLNVEAYPASARAYESLADAYAADGNKDLARTNYRKVLEINPQNTNVTEKLKKLD